MELTREQAITEHRKMWNWIADCIEKFKMVIDIVDQKRRYCMENIRYPVKNYCFLCEYTCNKNWEQDCKKCPIKWPSEFYELPCEGEAWEDDEEKYGLWWRCNTAKTWQEQARLARQIANLPERTDV